ncbi:MAG: hypothetical protein RIC14_11280 [Filomicrobium sp.]
MATIIAVHGTFAHMGGVPSETAAPGVEPQWWQRGSAAEKDFTRLAEGMDGPVKVEPFLWSGDNSELERRKAGSRLLKRLLELEATGETYCLIGHSHGGSVISTALTEAAVRKKPLNGLKRWITVGTPFVSLRRETTLFLRLSLFQKAIFIASFMLLLMFGAYVIGEFINGGLDFNKKGAAWRFAIYTGLMSLPFLLFWLVFKILDLRKLYFYRPSTLAWARQNFAPRWLGLRHEDDEAISGLSSIGGIKLQVFHRDFAVPFISILSVFLLPIIYFAVLASPTSMVGIAEYLRDDIYAISQYEKSEAQVIASRQEVRQLRRSLRRARSERDQVENGGSLVEQFDADKKVKELRKLLKDAREKMHKENPDLVPVERALRFKKRFLEKDGRPCEGGTLCGNGRDWALNSKLLFHIVTDEASSLVLDDDLWTGRTGMLLRLILPVILVPVVFGILAVLLVGAVQLIAGFISRKLSSLFDSLTWFEVKRSALGNDTETEVALTAGPNPFWIASVPPSLPSALGQEITNFSNEIAVHSLSKFRNAIGELAFSEGQPKDAERDVFSYLTWRELIHSSYFEVQKFRWLLVEAIATSDGFKRSAAFEGSAEAKTAASWVNDLDPGDGAQRPLV